MAIRDAVMALSDEELLKHIAVLLGAADTGESAPDYINKLDAAWDLWKQLEEEGFIVAIENGVRGHMLLRCRGTGNNKLIDVFVRDTDGNPARAICRAFVVIKEQMLGGSEESQEEEDE